MRDRVRLCLPGPHELGAVACRVGEVAAGDDAVERALQRPRTLRLHGVDAGHGRKCAEGDRLFEPVDAGARERAAADLDDQAVERGRRRRRAPSASVCAALDREAVQVALAGERERAGRERLRGARRTVGSPVSPGSRGHVVDDGAERRRGARARAGSASAGTKTWSVRSAGAATTAAASAALPQLAIASGAPRRPASPSRSATSSQISTPKRWRALCEPATLPVSSFTQTPPPARSRASRELVGPRERRDA